MPGERLSTIAPDPTRLLAPENPSEAARCGTPSRRIWKSTEASFVFETEKLKWMIRKSAAIMVMVWLINGTKVAELVVWSVVTSVNSV